MYVWRKGYPAKVDANTVGEITSMLESEERLTPEDLLEEARPEESPIHNCFEWNDSIAAEQFRLQQARSMIIALQITRTDETPVKKYFHITQDTGSYRSIEVLLSSEESREMLIERARKEFLSYQRKYENLKELADLFTAGKVVFGE